jgi:23S rRNA (uracil1939-C5)-methyltransferase
MAKKYTIRCKEINENFNGVFTFNNSKLEAPGLLPGEKASVTLLYGKDKGRAVVEEVLEPSSERVAPVCPIYGSCGGCALMHTNYKNQLQLKTDICKKLLSKFGNVGNCIGSEKEYNYRNKIIATLSTDKKGRVISGLYEETTHNVIAVNSCKIEDEHAAAVMTTIRKFMNDFHIKPYNEDNGRGILRHVLFRTAANGDTLVVLVSGSKIFPEKNKLAKAISEKHSFVKGIILNFNNKKTSFVLGPKDELLFGKDYVTDKMCGLEFRISGRSFYQINTPQAEKIYTDAITRMKIGANDSVLDAYCGIGTIALSAAKLSGAKEVLGVELNEAAVKDANDNAKKSGLKNVKFIQDDAGDYLMAAIGAEIHYNCIIMDPPRSGASELFLKAVLKMKPEKIVYISCNPVTLARDLSKLTAKKEYKAEYIQPYDMFPQTAHVEVVTCLQRVDS